MPSLNIKSFSELVSEQVIAIQARAEKLVDFSVGSILRSLAESNAGVSMWIQQLIVKLLVTTRASTCSGEDLDSWMADFNFPRLSAVQARGQVTFSRFTPTTQAFIPVNTQIATLDGTQAYSVIAKKSHNAWDDNKQGFVIAAGMQNLVVPVIANHAGSAGNAQAGSVSVITTSLQFVDQVINTEAFTNGQDAESDDDYRARFILWIASLSKATKAAIGFALSDLQNGVSFTLNENVSRDGVYQPGYFYAVVDDGSGSPSDDFLHRAFMAIDAVRGLTISFGVFRPEIIHVNVTLTVHTELSSDHAAVACLVDQAIKAYISHLSLGQLLAYTQLVRVAYDASPFVTNVMFLRLNDGMADIGASSGQVIRMGTITVN